MLTRARLRDVVAKRTGLSKSVVAHVLDSVEDVVREELVQQGEVVFRGLFRITPVQRVYASFQRTKDGLPVSKVPRIILTIRPTRSLRKKLTAVLAAR